MEPKSRLTPSRQLILLILLAGFFLALGFYYFGKDMGATFNEHPGDDWTQYHLRAVDVLRNGPTMPVVDGPYTIPAAFLYVYFLAGLYAVLGVSPGAVYLVQSAMLGLSVGLFFLAFRRGLSLKAQVLLLLSLIIYSWLDVERYYAGRLLSENLAMLEVAFLFNLLVWGHHQDKKWARICAIGWLGVIYLTRPNMLPFVLACPLWLAWVQRGRGRNLYSELALGLIILVLVVNLLGLRNYLVAGEWVVVSPLSWSQAVDGHLPHPWYWLDHPVEVLWSLIKRTLYAAGFLPVIVERFSYRPHWWLLWASYLCVLALRWRRGGSYSLEEQALHLYVLTVLGPVILVGHITGYGYRFLVPVTLPAVAMAARLWDEVQYLRGRRSVGEPSLT